MRKARLSCVAGAVLFALAGIAVANDQLKVEPANDHTRIGPAVAAGNYADLTFLRRVKLSAAYFVNPALAKYATVAYSFDPAMFKDAEKSELLIKLLKQGDVALAERAGNSVKVFDRPDDAEIIAQGLKATLEKVLRDQDTVIVSPSPDLLGHRSTRAIVNWGDPIQSEKSRQ